MGEGSGKGCRARRGASFLQQCPQLVQLQLVRKFHLGFPFPITFVILSVKPIITFLHCFSTPPQGSMQRWGKCEQPHTLTAALANISAPPPPETTTLLQRGQSCKPWVNTWKPLQKNQDPDFTWSHKTSQVHSDMPWCRWELYVTNPLQPLPGFGVRPPLSLSCRNLSVHVSLLLLGSLSTTGGTGHRSNL